MNNELRITHLRSELAAAESALPHATTKKERRRLEKIVTGSLSRLSAYNVATYELTDARFDGMPLNYRAR